MDKPLRRLSTAATLTLLAALLEGGCNGSNSEKLRTSELAEGCVLNSDCESPLVCAFRKCHTECTTSRDCAEGQRCVASDRPFRVCQLEEDEKCDRNSDCPPGMICGVDGECRDECVTNRDCIPGQVCTERSCADPEELVDGGLPPAPGGGGAGEAPDPCLYSTDCADGLVCRQGACVAECVTDRDCGPNAACTAGRCETVPPPVPECTFASDCPPGQFCDQGACRCRCADDRDCSFGETCDGCGCIPAPVPDAGVPECTFSSDCGDGEICDQGSCRCECRDARDCSAGESCDGCGCVSGSDAGPPADASACTFSSDCAAGQICDQGTCRCECRQDRDCGSGEQCDGCACVPLPPPDASGQCVFNSDCAAGQSCFQGACRCECQQTRDCATGEICDGCACVPDAPDGAPTGFGDVCDLPSDCPPGLVCSPNGRCVFECGTSIDCDPGFCCVDNRCVQGTVCFSDAGTGLPDSGADAPTCTTDLDCQDSFVCNGFERCNAGLCEPAADLPCDDDNPCTDDSCNESTGACSHVQTGPQDSDNDGHFAVSCGGDDCDDTNRDVHPGHAELCDGIDNDCNGTSDEGIWTVDAAVQLPGTMGNVYTTGQRRMGHYGIAPLANGGFAVVATSDGATTNGWVLDASFGAVEGPIALFGGGHLRGAGADSEGTHFVVGAIQSNLYPRAAWGTSFGGRTEHILSNAGGTGPDVTWNGAEYLLAWTDARDNTMRTYVGAVRSDGTLASSRPALPALADAASGSPSTNNIHRASVAVGGGKAIVAWSNPSADLSYALYDDGLVSSFTGLKSIPRNSNGTSAVMDTAYDGTSFVIASNYGNQIRLDRVDPATGDVTATQTFATPGDTHPAPYVTGTGNGVVFVGHSSATAHTWGFVPQDFSSITTWNTIHSTTRGTATLHAVDATTIVSVWGDGAAKVYVERARCVP